jgi:hypothetical protein
MKDLKPSQSPIAEKLPSKQLSSEARTWAVKFGFPVLFLLMGIPLLWFLDKETPPFLWVFFGALVIGGWLLVSWLKPVKRVIRDGDHFVISDTRNSITVPISHLCRVEADRENRTPSILIYFAPTTAFGDCVRIIPSRRAVRSGEFENMVAQLFDIVVANGYHPTALPIPRLKNHPRK